MFVVSLTYVKKIEEVEKHIEAHIAYLEKYYVLEKFIASGRKVPRTGGIILAQASSRDELDRILQEDPFHIAQVAIYDVEEFIPTMTAPGYAALKNFT